MSQPLAISTLGPAELRKGAAKYSDDEVDRLVNDAVTAVRGERARQRVKVGA